MRYFGMRTNSVALAFALLLSAGSARAFDVILDPAQISRLLADISRYHKESAVPGSGPAREAQLDALYQMGETVLDLADLMTQDFESHGSIDPALVATINRRLKESGVVISKVTGGYRYDLAAFSEYLRRAPSGRHAVDARYALIGFDEPGDDAAAIQRSIVAKENFVRTYPEYEDVSVVQLLVAQQHNRLARVYSGRHQQELSDRQRKLAETQYRRIIKLYPDSEEAQTAKDALAQ
jgi:hypothetical protein